jgi:hypothetical protein
MAAERPAPAPLQFFDLVGTLLRHDVEFVVIGGAALGFHGAPRATKDVDVVPAPGVENLTRLWNALAEIDAQPQGLDDFRPDELPVQWSLDGLIEFGGNWILHTRFGRVDVMQWVEPFSSYAELRRPAVAVRLDELDGVLLVAGFDELVAMKEAAGRDQDLIDIERLRMARGERE